MVSISKLAMIAVIALSTTTRQVLAEEDDSSGASGTSDGEYECDGTPDSIFAAKQLSEQTQQDADRWREIARSNLNVAREAATALIAMNKSATSYDAMAVEAEEKLAQAEGSFVTRQAKETLAVTAAERYQCERTTSECRASSDIATDCIPFNWVVARDCVSTGCGLSAKLETREFSRQPFCGGDKCGASVRISECPPLPSCDFNATYSVSQTLVLGGFEPPQRDSEDLMHGLHDLRTGLRVYYRDLLGHNGFRLDFNGVPSFGNPPLLIKDGRRRREDEDALSTYFDTEIQYEVQIDPAQNPSDGISRILATNEDSSALLALLTDSEFIEPTDGLLLSVVIEGKQCHASSCSGATCELVSNGCYNKVPCGDCGLASDCAVNFYACISGGDCSRITESTDAMGTMDPCLLDTSQLSL